MTPQVLSHHSFEFIFFNFKQPKSIVSDSHVHSEWIHFGIPPKSGDIVIHYQLIHWSLPITAHILSNDSTVSKCIEIHVQQCIFSRSSTATLCSLKLNISTISSTFILDPQSQYSLWIQFGRGFGTVSSDPVIIRYGQIYDVSTSTVRDQEDTPSASLRGMQLVKSVNSDTNSVSVYGWSNLHSDKLIEFVFTFDGNLHSVKWIVCLISVDGKMMSAPVVHDLQPRRF